MLLEGFPYAQWTRPHVDRQAAGLLGNAPATRLLELHVQAMPPGELQDVCLPAAELERILKGTIGIVPNPAILPGGCDTNTAAWQFSRLGTVSEEDQ